MTFRAVDVYELLEPLLKDYRKLRERNMGNIQLLSQNEISAQLFLQAVILWCLWMNLFTIFLLKRGSAIL